MFIDSMIECKYFIRFILFTIINFLVLNVDDQAGLDFHIYLHLVCFIL